MVGPAAKRDAVAHLKTVMGLSERRACQIISADRKMIRYRSSRPPEVELRTRLRELANERRRFGEAHHQLAAGVLNGDVAVPGIAVGPSVPGERKRRRRRHRPRGGHLLFLGLRRRALTIT